MMNNLCADIGYHSLNKTGEQLCGDHVEQVEQDQDSPVVVLADGLGSGVKACILSTLTSKIISTMMAESLSVEDCVSTIAATLPVCSVRQIAYSTFTILHIIHNQVAELFQYDNPQVILLRHGKNVEYETTSLEIGGKTILRSRIPLEEDDVFLLMSDGAIWAGVGKNMNFGWQREDIIEFMEMMYDPSYTAKTLATILLDECNRLYAWNRGMIPPSARSRSATGSR